MSSQLDNYGLLQVKVKVFSTNWELESEHRSKPLLLSAVLFGVFPRSVELATTSQITSVRVGFRQFYFLTLEQERFFTQAISHHFFGIELRVS